MQINVLFHGLFILQQKQDAAGNSILEAYAPKMMKHQHSLTGGVRSNIADLNAMPGPLDWTTNSDLQGNPKGNENDLLGSYVMRFSLKKQKLQLKAQDPTRIIRLPWPKHIFALRLDPISQFAYQKPSSVGDEIASNCVGQVGIVVAANYDYKYSGPTIPGWNPSQTYHFFYSAGKEQPGDVNDDLGDLANHFDVPGNFDLKMIGSELPGTNIDNPIPAPPGVVGIGPEDELAPFEHITAPLNAAGARFFLRTLEVNAVSPDEKERTERYYDLVRDMINPTNCPTLFLLS